MRKNKKLLVNAPWEVKVTEENFDTEITDDYDVIIKTLYTHISAGTEMACLSGLEDWFSFPNTPGYTAIGEVIATGKRVNDINEGDVVYTYGNHGSFFKLNRQDRWHGVCVKVPQGLQLEVAAFTHMAGIAITAIRTSEITLGDFVAVSGLGTIGNLAGQLAMLQGARVIAFDINDHRINIAKSCGLQHAINTSGEKVQHHISTFTKEKMVSTFIDATGIPGVINQSINYIETNGELILLGSPRKELQTNITPFLQKVHLMDNIKIKGALEFSYPTHNQPFSKHSIERNAAIIMDLMDEGKLKIQPLLTQKIKPEQAMEAYEGLRDKPDEYMGVVIDWT